MLVLTCHPWEVIKIGEALIVVEPRPMSGHHRVLIDAPEEILLGRIKIAEPGSPEAVKMPTKQKFEMARRIDAKGYRNE